MHRKNIRRLAKKQLKIKHSYWKTMSKKEKRELIKQVIEEVIKDYDCSQALNVPVEETDRYRKSSSSRRYSKYYRNGTIH